MFIEIPFGKIRLCILYKIWLGLSKGGLDNLNKRKKGDDEVI